MVCSALTPGSPLRRLFIPVYARHLVLLTLLMTAALLIFTLLMIPTTPPTAWTGSSHCAAAADNRKHGRSTSADDNATEISTSGPGRFVVNNAHLCDPVVDDYGMTSYPVYVVVVHSRPDQRGRMQRDAIRVTWGSPLHRRLAEPDIRLAFILGRDRECAGDAVESQCSGSVRRESRLYRDVIVADFVDTYRSLSLKSLAGLVWARRHCPTARYIVKVS